MIKATATSPDPMRRDGGQAVHGGRVDPWEQQPDETAPAFQAFAIYRDLGPDRSTAKVAEQLEKSARTVERWSSAHSWVGRVRAWDGVQDRWFRERLAHERRGAAIRSLEFIDKAKAISLKSIEEATKEGADSVSVRDAARLFEVALRGDASVFGSPETRVAVRSSDAPALRVSVDELDDEDQLAALKALRAEVDLAIAEMESESEGAPA